MDGTIILGFISLAALQVALYWLHATDLEQLERKLMATLADLDTEIQGDLTEAATAIETALTAALAKITVPPDVQPQIDHIKAIAAALKTAASGGTTVEVPPAPTP